MALTLSSIDPFYHPYAPVPSVELCRIEDKCFSCESSNLIEDDARGEVICTQCGYVQAERMIADDQQDFRNFEGDGNHKNHFGQATSIFYPGQLTSPHGQMREDVEFLWRGFRKIHRLVERVQRGRGCHQAVETFTKPIQSSAKSIFYRAYEMMLSEKKGTKKMSRTNTDRQRFARCKTFVVAAVWRSLHKYVYCYLTATERKSDKFVVYQPENPYFVVRTYLSTALSNLLRGAKVTRNSVNKCLKEIGEL